MKVLKKFVTMFLYAFLLLPGKNFQVDPGLLRAVEIASTALDRTMRRRKASHEHERRAKHSQLIVFNSMGDDTLTVRLKYEC